MSREDMGVEGVGHGGSGLVRERYGEGISAKAVSSNQNSGISALGGGEFEDIYANNLVDSVRDFQVSNWRGPESALSGTSSARNTLLHILRDIVSEEGPPVIFTDLCKRPVGGEMPAVVQCMAGSKDCQSPLVRNDQYWGSGGGMWQPSALHLEYSVVGEA